MAEVCSKFQELAAMMVGRSPSNVFDCTHLRDVKQMDGTQPSEDYKFLLQGRGISVAAIDAKQCESEAKNLAKAWDVEGGHKRSDPYACLNDGKVVTNFVVDKSCDTGGKCEITTRPTNPKL